MDPKGKAFWGPPIWKTIHIFAATLKPENGQQFKQFLELLTVLLPCDECQHNLRAKLKMIPPDAYLTNNHDAFFYTYLLHDLANEHITTTHPEQPVKQSPNYDEIKFEYFTALSQECKSCSSPK
jgi:hypothetical protein